MLPTLHDDYLISYEVNCEARQIRLSARHPAGDQECRNRAILFNGVEGYHFENDAFGNIIFSLAEVSVDQILSRFGSQIAESYRLAGAPGQWAADLASAPQVLTAKGVQGFLLTSSYGLSGWVLAKEALVVPS
jgi:hypothetical protein